MAERTMFTVGVCSFNEANNIEKCIRSIFAQEYETVELAEVIVVSSGSTDGTEAIVDRLAIEFDKLRPLIQDKREGKNSAINYILSSKHTELMVLVNADNILADSHCLQNLVEPLLDSTVGVTGGHPIPINKADHFSGFASQMIWCCHHHIAMESTKIGELVAFRDVGIILPLDTQSDEDYIRKSVEAEGLTAVYVPEATTYIMGPDCLRDLIIQRERVNIGQSFMAERENYYNPSRDPRVLMKVFSEVVKDLGFHPIKIALSLSIESLCRMKGRVYAKCKSKDINIWESVESTKRLK